MARWSKKSQKKVEKAMHEYKEGKLKSGKSNAKVTSKEQAIAIGLSQAREEGAKVPVAPVKKTAPKRKKAAPKKRASKPAAKPAKKKATPKKRKAAVKKKASKPASKKRSVAAAKKKKKR